MEVIYISMHTLVLLSKGEFCKRFNEPDQKCGSNKNLLSIYVP